MAASESSVSVREHCLVCVTLFRVFCVHLLIGILRRTSFNTRKNKVKSQVMYLKILPFHASQQLHIKVTTETLEHGVNDVQS